MKCPHCKYEDSDEFYDASDKYVLNEKEHGEHFQVSVKTEDSTIEVEAFRKIGMFRTNESRNVYACASCGILFISVD